MAEKLYRAQILLEPQQHAALRRLASQEGRSISEVAREVIAAGLAQIVEGRARQLAALERLSALRREIAQRARPRSVSAADLIAEVRAERESQLEQAVQGPTS